VRWNIGLEQSNGTRRGVQVTVQSEALTLFVPTERVPDLTRSTPQVIDEPIVGAEAPGRLDEEDDDDAMPGGWTMKPPPLPRTRADVREPDVPEPQERTRADVREPDAPEPQERTGPAVWGSDVPEPQGRTSPAAWGPVVSDPQDESRPARRESDATDATDAVEPQEQPQLDAEALMDLRTPGRGSRIIRVEPDDVWRYAGRVASRAPAPWSGDSVRLVALETDGENALLSDAGQPVEPFAPDQAAELIAVQLGQSRRDPVPALVLIAEGNAVVREDLAHHLAAQTGQPVWYSASPSRLHTDPHGVGRVFVLGDGQWTRTDAEGGPDDGGDGDPGSPQQPPGPTVQGPVTPVTPDPTDPTAEPDEEHPAAEPDEEQPAAEDDAGHEQRGSLLPGDPRTDLNAELSASRRGETVRGHGVRDVGQEADDSGFRSLSSRRGEDRVTPSGAGPAQVSRQSGRLSHRSAPVPRAQVVTEYGSPAGLDLRSPELRDQAPLAKVDAWRFRITRQEVNGVAGRSDTEHAPWWTPYLLARAPYFVVAGGSPRGLNVLTDKGSALMRPNEVADFLAAHPEVTRLRADVPIVLLAEHSGSGGLEMPRLVAARTGRPVWSFSGSLRLVAAPGSSRSIMETAVPADRSRPVGRWILSRPDDLGAHTPAERATVLPESGMVSLLNGGVLMDGSFVNETVTDSSHESLGRAFLADDDMADMERGFASLGRRTTYRQQRKDESGHNVPIPGTERPLPWVTDSPNARPYFLVAHGWDHFVELPRSRDNPDNVARVDAGQLGAMLKRRPSLSQRPADAPIVLVSCRTGGEFRVPEWQTAQRLADTTGRTVYAPSAEVSVLLNVRTGPKGNEGTWLTFRPATAGHPEG
ncbi:hypothetical protein ACGFYV_03920, partial [Streptomyces sp. NPDC048297]|uniref:hypothetical protein n=1 Tax=Streptomyces sp. NPDC048297 TaxID=3365531 RepID=UPI0037143B33